MKNSEENDKTSRVIQPDRKNIPDRPGVYFFRDNKRKILYVGKAAKLRGRLGSYFDLRPKDPRIAKMLNLAASMDYLLVNSEIEALILESQLIKKYKPAFNIMLRDDKQYFFVVFTKEKFPKILITHQQFQNFIGPFTDGGALKSTLKLLRKIFPHCACKQKHNNYCLNYHIGKCLGFCCLKNINAAQSQINPVRNCHGVFESPRQFGSFNPAPLESSSLTGRGISNGIKTYGKNVQAVKGILNGKRSSLVKKLEKEMTQKSKQNNFEGAIKLRDQIEKLKQVFENARIIQKVGGNESLKQLKKSLDLLIMPIRIEGFDISNIQGEFATGAMVVFTNGEPDKDEYRKFKISGDEPGDTVMLQEILTRRFKHREWQFPDLILIDGGKGQLNAAISILKNLKLDIPIIVLTKNEKHIGDHIFSTTHAEKINPVRNCRGVFESPRQLGSLNPAPLESSSLTGRGISNGINLSKLPREARNLILRIDAEAHRFAIGYYRKLHKNQFKNLTAR